MTDHKTKVHSESTVNRTAARYFSIQLGPGQLARLQVLIWIPLLPQSPRLASVYERVRILSSLVRSEIKYETPLLNFKSVY